MTEGIIKRYEIDRTRLVLYDVISSNITDPLTGQQARSDVAHWILDGFPNPAVLGNPAPKGWKFPIVVFEYPEKEYENRTVDGTKGESTLTITIECHSRSRAEASQLSDQIAHILVTSGQSELKKAALFGPDIASSDSDTDFIGGNKYYTKSVTYEFMRFD